MTRTSTGPLVDSSFNPSCSCKAVKMDGPTVSGDAAGLAGSSLGAGRSAPSGVHSRERLNVSVYPVLSITVRLVVFDSQRVRSFIAIPVALRVEFTPSLLPPILPQNAGWGSPGAGGGGRLLISKVTQFGGFTLTPPLAMVSA